MAVFINKTKTKGVTATALKGMPLHDMIDLGRVAILRVSTGWIYYSFEAGKVASAVFVPGPPSLDESEQRR